MKLGSLTFLCCESACHFTDVPAKIYDRTMVARHFDAIHDILRCLGLVQYLLKRQNAPIRRKREPTHMRLSGTDRLTNVSPNQTIALPKRLPTSRAVRWIHGGASQKRLVSLWRHGALEWDLGAYGTCIFLRLRTGPVPNCSTRSETLPENRCAKYIRKRVDARRTHWHHVARRQQGSAIRNPGIAEIFGLCLFGFII